MAANADSEKELVKLADALASIIKGLAPRVDASGAPSNLGGPPDAGALVTLNLQRYWSLPVPDPNTGLGNASVQTGVDQLLPRAIHSTYGSAGGYDAFVADMSKRTSLPLGDQGALRAMFFKGMDRGGGAGLKAYEDEHLVLPEAPEAAWYMDLGHVGPPWAWNTVAGESGYIFGNTSNFTSRVVGLQTVGIDPNNIGGSIGNWEAGMGGGGGGNFIGQIISGGSNATTAGEKSLKQEMIADRDAWCAANGIASPDSMLGWLTWTNALLALGAVAVVGLMWWALGAKKGS